MVVVPNWQDNKAFSTYLVEIWAHQNNVDVIPDFEMFLLDFPKGKTNHTYKTKIGTLAWAKQCAQENLTKYTDFICYNDSDVL